MFAIFINIIIYSMFFGNKQNEFSKVFKKEIISGLISNVFDENIEIEINKGITEEMYNVQVYKESYFQFLSKDLIEVNSNNLLFSEVCTRNVSNGDNDQRRKTIFMGIAGQKKLNKSLNVKFSVLRNILNIDNEVKLDSDEFEKLFNVECEDSVLAVRMLTADIMEMLVKLYTKYNMQFEFSIINSVMYFRIRSYKDFFEIPGLSSGLTKEWLYKNYEILNMIKNLTESINTVINDIEI